MELNLQFLGRGSAFNVAEGNTSAFIKKNGNLVLIDCGSTVFSSILASDTLEDIKNIYVLITHMHPDHVGSLGDLIFYCYYKMNTKVNIILSSGCKNIEQYLKLTGIESDKYSILTDTITDPTSSTIKVKSYIAMGDGLLTIVPFNVKHCDELDSVAYLLEYKGDIIVYTGDLNTLDFSKFKDTNVDRFYVDTCSADYIGNVHYNVHKLHKDCIENGIDESKIYCMHFDNYDAILEASDLGFNIVDTII